ncbi:hypothetical protein ACJX0J_036064, partial [Zea mays]
GPYSIMHLVIFLLCVHQSPHTRGLSGQPIYKIDIVGMDNRGTFLYYCLVVIFFMNVSLYCIRDR